MPSFSQSLAARGYPATFIVNWTDLSGIPTSFPPAAHTHIIADVNGLEDALNAKLPSASFTFANLSGKPATYPPTVGTTADTAKAGNYVPDWSEITNKPSGGGGGAVSWADITGKPVYNAPYVYIGDGTSTPVISKISDDGTRVGINTITTSLDTSTSGTGFSYNHSTGFLTLANASSSLAALTVNKTIPTTSTAVDFRYRGAVVGSINISSSAVAYNTTSDMRLKDSIVDAPAALGVLSQIQIRQFDWLVDGSHCRYGVIAQELVDAMPEAVQAPIGPDGFYSVNFPAMVPLLIKAVQELTARVADLEAQIDD